jgi:ketosteroid isomerase-like protein
MNRTAIRGAFKAAFWPAPAAFLVFFAAGAGFGQSGSQTLQSLINAERSFSKLSEEKGIKEAFLFYLADDSIVFRPKPVPGKNVYEATPDNSPALLNWEPAYAEVAPDGDLGYTTGPYELKDKSKPADPARHGHYVSLWQKQPGGLWKVVVDVGISHPQPGFRPMEVMTRKDTGRPKRPVKVDKLAELNNLLKVEAEFSARAAADGVLGAYAAFAHADIRFYRDGLLPMTGIESLRRQFSPNPGRCLPLGHLGLCLRDRGGGRRSRSGAGGIIELSADLEENT